MSSVFIHGMKGLGDNIYQRAFISKIQEEVFLETPWPELYSDLKNVKFAKCNTNLRTQQKNIEKSKVEWSKFNTCTKRLTISYREEGIINGMVRSFGFSPSELSLPSFGKWKEEKPYILVRPVTIRKEWVAETRNPLPEYVLKASTIAKNLGYKVISVADLQDGHEWALEPLPYADEIYHKGELGVEQLLSLAEGATALVGGIGWIVPTALAYKKPALIICGGQGGYNSPNNIIDERIDLAALNIEFAVPDKFCKCILKSHNCDKSINNYEQIFANWFNRLPALV